MYSGGNVLRYHGKQSRRGDGYPRRHGPPAGVRHDRDAAQVADLRRHLERVRGIEPRAVSLGI